MPRPKPLLFALATTLLTVAICTAGVEIAARAYGYRPRRGIPRPEPIMYEPDAVLGWSPIPGTYQLGPYTPDSQAVTVTIRPDGARETGARPAPDRRSLLLVGCSFTMGWAVADADTWASRVQQLRPDLDVVNRGAAGYGTYQALLLLEERLQRNERRPDWILYGDIGHDIRNVGSLAWLTALSQTRSTVATPYCTFRADGSIARHPPQSYPALPLHQHLASVALLENVWARWQVRDRAGTNGSAMTDHLIGEMAALCRRHGVGFSVVILSLNESTRLHRITAAQQRQIDVIDCNQISPPFVPGEGHPNAIAHERWGTCVAAAMTQRLGSTRADLG